MTCEDHHLGMQYVQVKAGQEPDMKPWCFTCSKQPRFEAAAPSAETKPPAVAAAKRTPRSKNGVRSS